MIKISRIKLEHIVALDATLIHFINMAKINLVTKNINAVFVNINLLRILLNIFVQTLTKLTKGKFYPESIKKMMKNSSKINPKFVPGKV